ncbi:MAG TPA: hypothetical protein VGR06_02950 [Actinophytocola sp.]|jgi:hypothetical protein|uniref:hypothetical protein n=1 Tax=Actinophytocola sp. TaxID=1872138 RepID=UPI002E072C01|nr:hypothetical protein [Actinophytocola sp.]
MPVVEPASSSADTGDGATIVSVLTSANQVLTTGRLTLRPWRVDDAQAALEIYARLGNSDLDRAAPEGRHAPNRTHD